ncbi:hypothetical protein Ciccas_011338, partial [Cichlidogyrus casuarinus]
EADKFLLRRSGRCQVAELEKVFKIILDEGLICLDLPSIAMVRQALSDEFLPYQNIKEIVEKAILSCQCKEEIVDISQNTEIRNMAILKGNIEYCRTEKKLTERMRRKCQVEILKLVLYFIELYVGEGGLAT